MKIPAIGRNDPCPCGSGRKYKKCCLIVEKPGATSNGAAGVVSAELRQALAARQFGSFEEVQTFVAHHAQERNQKPLDEFHGLSPEQMYHMLHLPFTSPELVRFPEVLNTRPTAPILTLFELRVDAIGEQGLKPTAKGNLPQKFCRKAALVYWGEENYRENTRVGGINREENFFDLHVTRTVAELTGLIRKYKGRFILGRDCHRMLAGEGMAAIYPQLLRTYIEQFNWGYRDGYPELHFIQSAFLFTLYMLMRYGDTWQPHKFYEDCFLRAFPMVLDEIPEHPFFNPEEEVRNCYTWRTLVHFVGFFGLADVAPVSDERFCHEYRVKGLPLLHEAAQFNIPG